MNRQLNKRHQSIVFASANKGKIRELDELLTPLGYQITSQAELQVKAVPETALTFIENALIKARNACECTGLPAIADDSGLEVDALQGAPGLYSARYAEQHGFGQGDVDNYRLLLQNLRNVPDAERNARFRCVIVYLRHVNDPAPLIAEGVWEGTILHAATGTNGFGYDPVFLNADTGQAAAQLDKTTKNRLSHRGKAVQKLLAGLNNTRDRYASSSPIVRASDSSL